MKITKRQLKQIIREEKRKLVNEGILDWFKGGGDQPGWLKFAIAWAQAGPAIQQEVLKIYNAHTSGSPLTHPEDVDTGLASEAYELFWDILTKDIADSPASEMAAALEDVAGDIYGP